MLVCRSAEMHCGHKINIRFGRWIGSAYRMLSLAKVIDTEFRPDRVDFVWNNNDGNVVGNVVCFGRNDGGFDGQRHFLADSKGIYLRIPAPRQGFRHRYASDSDPSHCLQFEFYPKMIWVSRNEFNQKQDYFYSIIYTKSCLLMHRTAHQIWKWKCNKRNELKFVSTAFRFHFQFDISIDRPKPIYNWNATEFIHFHKNDSFFHGYSTRNGIPSHTFFKFIIPLAMRAQWNV